MAYQRFLSLKIELNDLQKISFGIYRQNELKCRDGRYQGVSKMEDTREVLTVDYQPKLETRDKLIAKGFTDDTINKEVQNFIDYFIETPARCSDMDALFMIWMRKVQFVNELRLERELEKQKG